MLDQAHREQVVNRLDQDRTHSLQFAPGGLGEVGDVDAVRHLRYDEVLSSAVIGFTLTQIVGQRVCQFVLTLGQAMRYVRMLLSGE